MNDWNPKEYLRFKTERTQPSIDLISRINCVDPKSIIDIGCGPGNSAQILAKRWPNSHITGLDKSPAMIEQARKDYPDQEWILAGVLSYETNNKFDIVFSNAAIQWIPNHEKLLLRFYNLLSDDGLIAIQVPLFWDMPLGMLIEKVAKNPHWDAQTRHVSKLFTIHDQSFYYNQLSKFFNSIEMWQTDYIHVLDSQRAILDMIRSSGLKPYLSKLDDEAVKHQFEEEVMEEIIKAYPLQEDNKVLLPFKRLFFIGYR